VSLVGLRKILSADKILIAGLLCKIRRRYLSIVIPDCDNNFILCFVYVVLFQ
jgi:hypothetical protein